MDPAFSKNISKFLALGSQGGNDSVDPYAIVSFAGHKEKTKVIDSNCNPEWKSQVNLEVRVCCAMHYCDC